MNIHTRPPAASPRAIPAHLSRQERGRQKAIQRVRKLRERASAEIERLIQFLDETDGYTMTEAEPSLGAPEIAPTHQHYSEKYDLWFERQGDQSYWAVSSDDDREADGGDDEPSMAATDGMDGFRPDRQGGEGEPSLGWTDDLNEFGELDEDDLELDTSDDEPSLGWSVTGAIGNVEDLEDDNDSGIADADGFLEQLTGIHPVQPTCATGFAKAAI